MPASNATFFGEIDGVDVVYKPVSGERPLWDFPDGTLAGREVATAIISEAAGIGAIPPTVLRDGPFGPGMVQLWIETTEDDLVEVRAPDDLPDGWRVVLHAHDRLGEPAVLAHADHPGLRDLAVLDIVVNNTDRKGGHLLPGLDGRVYGVDHGICLHTDPKLRTVLWGWIGEPVPPDTVEKLRKLRWEFAAASARPSPSTSPSSRSARWPNAPTCCWPKASSRSRATTGAPSRGRCSDRRRRPRPLGRPLRRGTGRTLVRRPPGPGRPADRAVAPRSPRGPAGQHRPHPAVHRPPRRPAGPQADPRPRGGPARSHRAARLGRLLPRRPGARRRPRHQRHPPGRARPRHPARRRRPVGRNRRNARPAALRLADR